VLVVEDLKGCGHGLSPSLSWNPTEHCVTTRCEGVAKPSR
jgi:hypothetical protein